MPRIDMKRLAIQILAALSELDELHAEILSQDFRQIVLRCRQSTDPTIEAACLQMFANICANPNLVTTMNDMSLSTVLSESCGSPHAICRKYAFTGLGNLASHPTARADLRRMNFVQHFMDLLATESTPNGFFKAKYDLEEKRACVFALANCLSRPSNLPYISSTASMVIKHTFKVMQGGDVVLQRYGSLLLSNIAAGLFDVPVFSDKYVIQLIVKLAKTSWDPATKRQAFGCLRSIAMGPNNVTAMLECQVSSLLLEQVKHLDVVFGFHSDVDSDPGSDDENETGTRRAKDSAARHFAMGGPEEMKMARELLRLIYSLTYHTQCALELVHNGMVGRLVRLLSAGDPTTQFCAAMALANFSQNARTTSALIQEGCLGLRGLLDAISMRQTVAPSPTSADTESGNTGTARAPTAAGDTTGAASEAAESSTVKSEADAEAEAVQSGGSQDAAALAFATLVRGFRA